MYYSSSCEKTSSTRDLQRFPLLRYAAQSWYYYLSSWKFGDFCRETSLLQSESAKRDWLLVHRPDMRLKDPFVDLEIVGSSPYYAGSSLYYASYTGLQTVVRKLLICGADVEAQGGRYGNALQAASAGGHMKVLEMLIERGADVNAQGGAYGNALQAASARGHANVVKMLMERCI